MHFVVWHGDPILPPGEMHSAYGPKSACLSSPLLQHRILPILPPLMSGVRPTMWPAGGAPPSRGPDPRVRTLGSGLGRRPSKPQRQGGACHTTAGAPKVASLTSGPPHKVQPHLCGTLRWPTASPRLLGHFSPVRMFDVPKAALEHPSHPIWTSKHNTCNTESAGHSAGCRPSASASPLPSVSGRRLAGALAQELRGGRRHSPPTLTATRSSTSQQPGANLVQLRHARRVDLQEGGGQFHTDGSLLGLLANALQPARAQTWQHALTCRPPCVRKAATMASITRFPVSGSPTIATAVGPAPLMVQPYAPAEARGAQELCGQGALGSARLWLCHVQLPPQAQLHPLVQLPPHVQLPTHPLRLHITTPTPGRSVRRLLTFPAAVPIPPSCSTPL
jgi:hypothetical protein